jgi:gamma-glutamylcyclotransferase (GGCT)/AIG2-like uncharacterized protein YtfP
MPVAVFTYGSLMFPSVWERVVEGRYCRVEAIVEGYQRYEVHGETYPGMIAATGQSVRGAVYFDVCERDLAALDAFEGADYRRDELTAVLAGGEKMPVAAYVYLPTQRLSGQVWRPDEFPIQQFLDTYCRARTGAA